MSKKRNQKNKWLLTKPKTETSPEVVKEVEVEVNIEALPPAETPTAQTTQTASTLPPPPPSREEQMARMLFVDFFLNALHITERFETDDIIIEAVKEKELKGGKDSDDVALYSVVSKSNPNVVVYIDPTQIVVCLKEKPIILKKDEVIYLATNILGYVKNAYKKIA